MEASVLIPLMEISTATLTRQEQHVYTESRGHRQHVLINRPCSREREPVEDSIRTTYHTLHTSDKVDRLPPFIRTWSGLPLTDKPLGSGPFSDDTLFNTPSEVIPNSLIVNFEEGPRTLDSSF